MIGYVRVIEFEGSERGWTLMGSVAEEGVTYSEYAGVCFIESHREDSRFVEVLWDDWGLLEARVVFVEVRGYVHRVSLYL